MSPYVDLLSNWVRSNITVHVCVYYRIMKWWQKTTEDYIVVSFSKEQDSRIIVQPSLHVIPSQCNDRWSSLHGLHFTCSANDYRALVVKIMMSMPHTHTHINPLKSSRIRNQQSQVNVVHVHGVIYSKLAFKSRKLYLFVYTFITNIWTSKCLALADHLKHGICFWPLSCLCQI